MNRKPFSGSLLLALLFFCLLAGCVAPVRSAQSGDDPGAVFRPPTPLSAASPTTAPSAAPQIAGDPAALDPGQPTPTVACLDNLTFRSDITIPDGTLVKADSTLDKRWEVENTGNCNWNEQYRVRLIAGLELGAQPEQALFPARSASRAIIRIVFKAPAEPGSYRSAWQAFDPQGEPFGDPFFIEIIVE